MSNKLALSLHLGQGRVSVASGIVNDIPSIVIEHLAKPLPVGTEVPQEAEKVDFSIVLHFHSVEAIEALENKRPLSEWIKGPEISRMMMGDNILSIDYKDYTCSKCGLVLDCLLYHVDGSPFYKFCSECGC